jgi:hypothetical protein
LFGVNQMSVLMPERVLIAEDDARWLRELDPHTYFPRCVIVDNVAAAIREIESSDSWDAAIFDKYLMAGDVPYDQGRLASEAGYALAICFQRRFPGKRMVICTGASRGDPVPESLRELLHPALCLYINKGDSDGADRVRRFLRGEPGKIRLSDSFLRYLELKPNFCGLGVDLENVIRGISNWITRSKPALGRKADRQVDRPPGERFVSATQCPTCACGEIVAGPTKRAILVVDQELATGRHLAGFISRNLAGEEEFLASELFPHEAETMSWYLDNRAAAYYAVEAVESISQLQAVLSHLFPEVVIACTSGNTLDEWEAVYRSIHTVNSEASFIVVSDEAAILDSHQLRIDNIVGVVESPFHFHDVLRQIVLRVVARQEQTHIARDGHVPVKKTDLPLCLPDVPHYVPCLYDVYHEADAVAWFVNHALSSGQPLDGPIIPQDDDLCGVLDGRVKGRYWAVPISTRRAFGTAVAQLSPRVLVVHDLSEAHYMCVMDALKSRSDTKLILVGECDELRVQLAHNRCKIPPGSVSDVVEWSTSYENVFCSLLRYIRASIAT